MKKKLSERLYSTVEQLKVAFLRVGNEIRAEERVIIVVNVSKQKEAVLSI